MEVSLEEEIEGDDHDKVSDEESKESQILQKVMKKLWPKREKLSHTAKMLTWISYRQDCLIWKLVGLQKILLISWIRKVRRKRPKFEENWVMGDMMLVCIEFDLVMKIKVTEDTGLKYTIWCF